MLLFCMQILDYLNIEDDTQKVINCTRYVMFCYVHCTVDGWLDECSHKEFYVLGVYLTCLF